MKLSTLDLINNQLKDEGKKFKLVVYRNKYQIRGTFRFSNGKKKRAYISLDVPAEEASLREAKKRCDMIFYRYEDIGYIPDVLPFEKVVISSGASNQILVKDAKELFIKDWWRKRSDYGWWLDPEYEKEKGGSDRGKYINRNKAGFKPPTTKMLNDLRCWRGITPYINHVDQIMSDKTYLTVGALYQIAKSAYATDTKGRHETVTHFTKIIRLCKEAKFDVGGDVIDLQDIKGNYRPKKRANITDEELIELVKIFCKRYPYWAWCTCAMLVWGCRLSETFNLSPNTGDAYGTAQIFGLKEDGAEVFEDRTALGKPEELIKEFDLFNIQRPYYYNDSDQPYNPIKSKEFTDSWGKKFARVIKDLQTSSTTKFPKITLYDIRHAYARRLIKLNINTATAADSMGNSEAIFTKTYLKAMNKRDMAYIQKNI